MPASGPLLAARRLVVELQTRRAQALHQFLVVRLAEELEDALGDLRPHFFGALQFVHAGRGDARPCCRNASARNTAVRSPTKRMPSALSTRGSGFCLEFSMLRDHVGGGFRAHALERRPIAPAVRS